MATSPRTQPVSAPETDGIASAINRLCDEIHVLRESIDTFREDFAWVTRNGLPVQPIEHIHVKRMALDPCAGDWNEQLIIERSTSGTGAPTLESLPLDRIADDLKTTFEAIAQGQLEVVLTALDGVRVQVLAALKKPGDTKESPSATDRAALAAPVAPVPPAVKPEPGRLF